MACQIVTNGSFECGHTGECSAPDALARDLREEALDQIEPGGTGRREVEVGARMLSELGFHRC